MDLAVAAARELVAAKTSVIVAVGPEISLRAALAPNSGLPIVILAFNYDPIARGYVESLAHPGGNITGLFTRQPELAVKQLQLLVEAFPGKDRLGVLRDDQTAEQFENEEDLDAIFFGGAEGLLEIIWRRCEFDRRSLRGAFFAPLTRRWRSSPLFAPHNKEIADLAIRHRLPAMFTFRIRGAASAQAARLGLRHQGRP
jgi:putative tryptophan/tyrosine transport system substrate-binding protein